MDIQVHRVRATGELETELVILKVVKDCNVGWYLLFDNTYDEQGKPSNLWRHLYLFPDKHVNAGDFVWLYTKKGINHIRTNDSNTTTHVLYWGLGNTIWNTTNGNDVVHLVKYEDSQSQHI